MFLSDSRKTMLSKKKFNEGMAIMCEVFERDPSELLLKAYYSVLKEMSDQDFEHSVKKAISCKKYNKLPLPAELLDRIDPEASALLAFDKFRKGKDRTGIYDSVIFDDRIIHAVIQAMGGWQDVCLITEDEWRFKRKEFLDLYKAFSQYPPGDVPEKLIGYHEHQNSINGFDRAEEPVEFSLVKSTDGCRYFR